MRILAAAALLGLVVVPVASAQSLPQATLSQIRLNVPLTPQDPGAEVAFVIEAKRGCPSVASVMAEQDVQIMVAHADAGTPAKDDPVGTMHFPQHICSTEGALQAGQAPSKFKLAAGVERNATLSFVAQFLPGAVQSTEVGVQQSQSVPFEVLTTPAPPAPMVEETRAKQSPDAGSTFLLLGLVGLAVVLRRR